MVSYEAEYVRMNMIMFVICFPIICIEFVNHTNISNTKKKKKKK